ncbi:cysteine peptidase family C39 domain-containing protein [Mucilaginibacter sp. SJ]|uniref:cysteine peptidase family C39 domain-containing protein n=1 Tax=Mucilaginibacter sp. SJ TaxID=3029053 RepID=UPI0023A9F37D|nr:cysteine peptidase family C39 domain-containing protein [Mucilaginibacter sp. SJ]WEA01744.1 cysteine peptidase family C39 domain-containing protein [Mucilaginibacter sp. SJ]
MPSIRQLNKIYKRQISDNDCGHACLTMILRYAGLEPSVQEPDAIPIGPDGLSLFELKAALADLHLNAKAIEMDIDHLNEVDTPCIIHTVSATGATHFMVCFGRKKVGKAYFYVIGDPANGLILMSKNELDACWQSRSALYFPILAYHHTGQSFLAKARVIFNGFERSRGLLLIVPVMSASSIFFGIALAWLLQETSHTGGQASRPVILCWVLLLVSLSLSRGLLNYLRQQLLVNLTNTTSDRLNRKLIDHIFFFWKGAGRLSDTGIKNTLRDIQRISQSSLGITSIILPDLLLCLFFLAGATYLSKAVAVSTGLMMILQGIFISRKINDHNTFLNTLAADAKNFEMSFAKANEMLSRGGGRLNAERLSSMQNASFSKLSLKAITFGKRTNTATFQLELINTLYLAVTFLLAVLDLQEGSLSPAEMVTLVAGSFYISTIPSRIFGILPQIEAGFDACRQFRELCG